MHVLMQSTVIDQLLQGFGSRKARLISEDILFAHAQIPYHVPGGSSVTSGSDASNTLHLLAGGSSSGITSVPSGAQAKRSQVCNLACKLLCMHAQS